VQHVVLFFIGLKFDASAIKALKEQGQPVNCSTPAINFRNSLVVPEKAGLAVNVVKKKMVPDWVKSQYNSLWPASSNSPPPLGGKRKIDDAITGVDAESKGGAAPGGGGNKVPRG